MTERVESTPEPEGEVSIVFTFPQRFDYPLEQWGFNDMIDELEQLARRTNQRGTPGVKGDINLLHHIVNVLHIQKRRRLKQRLTDEEEALLKWLCQPVQPIPSGGRLKREDSVG